MRAFELFATKRREYARRMPIDSITPTIKQGRGSVMVLGAISTFGSLPLKKIDGTMDKKMYHSILCHRAIRGRKSLIGKGFIFQEDNYPKHSSYYC